MGYNNLIAESQPEKLADAIRDRACTIANTGNYNQAVSAMTEAFKKSQALADWFDCPDTSNEEICHRQATQAVFFFRIKKVSVQNNTVVRTDVWPAGKLNTEFAMFCTGKSKEEIEKIYLEYLKKAH